MPGSPRPSPRPLVPSAPTWASTDWLAHHPVLQTWACGRADLISAQCWQKVGRVRMQGLGLDSHPHGPAMRRRTVSGVQSSGVESASGTAPGSGSGSGSGSRGLAFVMRAGVVDIVYTCPSPDNWQSRRPLLPLALVPGHGLRYDALPCLLRPLRAHQPYSMRSCRCWACHWPLWPPSTCYQAGEVVAPM